MFLCALRALCGRTPPLVLPPTTTMSRESPTPDHPAYAPALIRLLQGPVHHDDAEWNLLLRHQPEVRAYFEQMGLVLYLSEADGYAFLRQGEPEEGEALPRLVRRIPLNYPSTLLSVILRERLLQHEVGDIDSPRLVVSRDELIEAMLPFMPPRGDETRSIRIIGAAVNRAVDMGFLTALKVEDDVYEVRRLVKAQLTVEKLTEVKRQLEEHASDAADD